jgi:glycosyltransferase involved in cell wall biosynthesis
MSGIGIFLKILLENLPDEHQYILIGDRNLLAQFSNTEIIDCSIPIFSFKELFAYPVSIVNDCDAFFIPNWNIPARIKIPIFSVIHDVVFLDMPGIISFFGRIIRYLMLYRAMKISRHIFTVSEFSQQRITHYFKNKKKITVIYLDVLKEIKSYSELNEKDDKNYYIFIGNIKKHKSLKTLISAFEKLNNGYQLFIVGKRDDFHTQENSLDINNRNIIFTGYISERELYNLLYNAKALIQPSLYEGFGLPPLEALWLKTPVILSDIPVFKELYNDMPVAFFKVGDDNELAEKMNNIKHFDYEPKILLKKYDAKKIVNSIFSVIENRKY